MKTVHFFKWMFAMLLVAFTMVGCGDDDNYPIPEPEVKPEKVYKGYAISVQIDSVAGNGDALLSLLSDTIKLYCPALKEVSKGVYKASLVYEEGKEEEYQSWKDGFKALLNGVRGMNLKQPVATCVVRFKNVFESNVKSDWEGNFSLATTSNSIGCLIPKLSNVVWATDDPKAYGVEELSFPKVWIVTEFNSTMFSGRVKLNGTDEYQAMRIGKNFGLVNKENKLVYGFIIDESGDSFTLVQVAGENLAEEERVTFTYKGDVE